MDAEDLKFVSTWESTRKRGLIFYIFTKELIFIIAGLVGSAIGLGFKNKVFPNLIDILNYSKPILLGMMLGAFIGALLWWNFNEKTLLKN